MTLDESVEVQFAKRLASNDKRHRDRALVKVRSWLRSRSSLPATASRPALAWLDLLQLWKGLFFCMWMSDKPLVQEQLAENISSLVSCLSGERDPQLFVDAALVTLAREWSSLDHIRRDKFLMLARRVWRHWLMFVAERNWSDDTVSRLLHLCRKHIAAHTEQQHTRRRRPRHHNNSSGGGDGGAAAGGDGGAAAGGGGDEQQVPAVRVPLGLQMHLIEIYPEELAKVSGGRLSSSLCLQLFSPFIELLRNCTDSRLKTSVTKHIFHYLMQQSDPGLAYQPPTAIEPGKRSADIMSDDDDAEESADEEAAEDPVLDPRAGGVDVHVPQLQLDYGQLSQQLLLAGADSATHQTHRNLLYRLAAQFNELKDGEYPLRAHLSDDESLHSDIDDNELELACQKSKEHMERLMETERELCADEDVPESSSDAVSGRKRSRQQQQQKKKQSGLASKRQKRLLASAQIIDVEPVEPSLLQPLSLSHDAWPPCDSSNDSGDGAGSDDDNECAIHNGLDGSDSDGGGADVAETNGDGEVNGDGADASYANGATHCRSVSNGDAHCDQLASALNSSTSDGDGGGNYGGGGDAESDSTRTGKLRQKKHGAARRMARRLKTAYSTVFSATGTPLDDAVISYSHYSVAELSPNTSSLADAPSSAAAGHDCNDTTTSVAAAAPAVISDAVAVTPLLKKSKLASKETSVVPTVSVSKRRRTSKQQLSPRCSDEQPLTAADGADSPAETAGGGAGDSSTSFVSARKTVSSPAGDWALPGTEHWETCDTAPSSASTATVPAFVRSACATVGRAKRRRSAKSSRLLSTPVRKICSETSDTGSSKKVNINLAMNTSQGFQEHLVTVRNSPQTPHNPHKMPIKGLLKTNGGHCTRAQAVDFF